MANKSVFQKYNEDALTHFNLKNGPYIGFIPSFQNPKDIQKLIMIQNEPVYDKICEYIYTQTCISPDKSTKKAFILPGCPVSQDRLKAICTEHNITVTNNYEIADLIITYDRPYNSFGNSENIKTQTMNYQLWNYDSYTDTNGKVASVDKYHLPVLCDEKWYKQDINVGSLANSNMLIKEFVITGLGLNIAYLISTKQVESINCDDLMLCSSSIQKLTKKLLSDINHWSNSTDQSDLDVLAAILPTIDTRSNHHLLWQLCQDLDSMVYKLIHSKDLNHWYDCCNWNKFANMNAEEMIFYLRDEEKLDASSFKYLEKHARTEIEIDNRNLYSFKVSVIDEFKKYME